MRTKLRSYVSSLVLLIASISNQPLHAQFGTSVKIKKIPHTQWKGIIAYQKKRGK